MRKSHKSKDRINNITIIIILLALLWSLYSIFKNDLDTIQRHLTECRKECYPRQVVETLSNRICVCQDPPPTEDIEEQKGGQWQTLNPDSSI